MFTKFAKFARLYFPYLITFYNHTFGNFTKFGMLFQDEVNFLPVSIFFKISSKRLREYLFKQEPDSDWPQLRGLAILALRGALKFFAVLNVLGEDFMVFWKEHD